MFKKRKVTVLDTGLANSPCLNVVEKVSFTSYDYHHSGDSHANSVCKIIGSQNKRHPGISPGCQICSYKINSNLKKDNNSLFLALQKCFDTDIINMSFACRTISEECIQLIKELHSTGIIMFASSHNDMMYPHGLSFIKSVGNTITPGEINYNRSWIGLPEFKGTSASCAIASGLASRQAHIDVSN